MRRQFRERVILVVHSGHRRGLEQLDAMAIGQAFFPGVDLLDCQGLSDLAAWLAGVIRILALQNQGGAKWLWRLASP